MTSPSSSLYDFTALRGLCNARQLRRLCIFGRRWRFEVVESFSDKWQILYVEESDVDHITDDYHCAACLNHLQHTHVYRFTAYGFDDGQNDVTAVENWNRQHV